jgi:hypothetical protein
MRATFILIILILAALPLFGQNAAPYVASPIAPFSFNEDSANYSINLNTVFADPDGDALDFSATGQNHIAVTINSGVVALSPESNWSGTESIVFTAEDHITGQAATNAVVTVLPINDAPYVAVAITQRSVTQGQTDSGIDLNVMFNDADLSYGDLLIFSVSGQNHVATHINAGVVTLEPVGEWIGSESMTFRATDTQGEYATQSVIVHVIHSVVANVSVTPNPFSPDNDGQKDFTTIHFYSSANGSALIEIYQTTRVGGIFIPGPNVYTEDITVNSGWNQRVWDGSCNAGGYSGTAPDGSYGMRITIGEAVYQIDFTIKVDTIPPTIDVISSYPNPFSPNEDGYQDFHQVRLRVDDVITEYLGLIRVNLWQEWNDPMLTLYPDSTYLSTCFVHEDGLTPVRGDSLYWMLNRVFQELTDGGYLFVIRDSSHPVTLSSGSNYDLMIGGNVPGPNNMVNISTGTSMYKIGDYQFPFLTVTGVGSDDHESPGYDDKTGYDYLRLFIVEGNASFNIYTDSGAPYSLNNEFPMYYGDQVEAYDPFTNDFLFSMNFEYNITIPGTIEFSNNTIPDGRYIYRVIVTDQAMHAAEETGELLVDNFPVQITSSVTPTSISPGNHDGYFDQSVIQYQVNTRSNVTVKIWDSVTNALVRTLRDGVDTYESGYVIWDGKDSYGNPVSPGAQHQYTVEITAQDHDINIDVASVHYTINVDNVGPEPAEVFLLGGDPYVTNPHLTVGGISNDVTSDVLLYLNGVYLGPVATTPAYPGYFDFPVTLSEGENTIYVRLRDAAWNLGGVSNSVQISLDSSAPVIHTTFPPADTLFRVNTFRCLTSISDLEGIGVDPNTVRFGFSLYGNTISWRNAHPQGANSNIYYYDYTVASGVDELDIEMYVRASDLLGNAAETEDPLAFSYKAVIPPEIESVSPADSTVIRALPDNRVAVRVYDHEGLGLNFNDTYLRLKRIGGAVLPGVKTITGLGNHEFSVAFTPQNPLADGWYELYAEIKDLYSGGGSVTRDTTFFLYDATAPLATNQRVGNATVFSSLTEGAIINHSLTYVSVDISDATAGIDLTDCSIALYNSLNNEVPGTFSGNYARLTWTLNTELLVNEANSGNYHIVYQVRDLAGNLRSESIGFILAGSNAPQLLGTLPAANTFINTLTGNMIEVSFNEALGMNSSSTVTWIHATSPSGTVYSDGAGATLALINQNPHYTLRLTLSQAITENGSWQVSYRLQNNSGLTFASTFFFTFDNIAPAVSSVYLGLEENDFTYIQGDEVITTGVNYAEVALNDFYGVDFTDPLTTIGVYNMQNELLPGAVSVVNDTNLRFTLEETLRSINRYYYVKLTAVDAAGNFESDSTRFEMNTIDCTFYPLDQANVNSTVDHASIAFDYDGNVMTNGSDILVTDPDGQIIHANQGGTLTINQSGQHYTMRLNFSDPLSMLGDDDGRYHVEAVIMPSDGNEFGVEYTFLLDSQNPGAYDLRINGDTPANLDGLVFSQPVQTISAVFSDSLIDRVREVSGVDFSPNCTKVLLLGPTGQLLHGSRSYDGVRTVTWTLAQPMAESGQYTIRLMSRDYAGNSYQSNLILTLQFPEIVSHTPAANSCVNLLAGNRVSVTANLPLGIGLDRDATSISLAHGAQTWAPQHNATMAFSANGDQATASLVITGGLATNGSMDGLYQQTTVIVDSLGAEASDTIAFIYDTQDPWASDFMAVGPTSTPIAENGVVNHAITALSFHYNDDATVLNESAGAYTLEMRNPSNALLPGTVSYNAGTFTYALGAQLPANGTADGLYTLHYSFHDQAGNTCSGDLHFNLVNPLAPQLIDTTPASGSTIAALDQNAIVIRVSDTQGISSADFTSTYIRLQTPDGQTIAHNAGAIETITLDAGVYTIRLTLSQPLTLDGVYQVDYRVQNLSNYHYASHFNFTIDAGAPVINGFFAVSDNVSDPITDGAVLFRPIQAVTAVLLDTASGIDYLDSGTFLTLSDNFGNLVPGQLTHDATAHTVTWTLDNTLATIGGQYVVRAGAIDNSGNPTTRQVSFQLNAFNGEVLSYTPDAGQFTSGDVDRFSIRFQDLGIGGLNQALTYVQATHPNGGILGDPSSAGQGTGGHLQITQESDIYTVSLLLNQPLSASGADDGLYSVRVNLVTSNNSIIPLDYSFTYDKIAPFYTNLLLNGGSLSALRARNAVRREIVRETFTEPIDSVGVGFGDLTSGIDPTANLTCIYITDANDNILPGVLNHQGARWIWVLNHPIPIDGTSDGTYRIRLRATDLAGNTLNYAEDFQVFSPTAPANLTCTLDAIYRVHLNWNTDLTRGQSKRRADNRDALYYAIERSYNGQTAVALVYTAETTYVDNLASCSYTA